jgi:hypothetical protein
MYASSLLLFCGVYFVIFLPVGESLNAFGRCFIDHLLFYFENMNLEYVQNGVRLTLRRKHHACMGD